MIETQWRDARRPAFILMLFVSHLCAAPAGAQDVVPAATGAVLGLMAGGLVSAGIITLQARRGAYVYSPEDALKWEAAAIPLGVAAGLAVGLGDRARARRTLIGGAAGMAAGAAVGALLGGAGWDRPEGLWAGGVIGAAAGVFVGSLVGVLLPGEEDGPADETAAARLQIRLPFP